MSKRAALFLFLALVVGGGLLIGWFNIPGLWYEALRKPWFNPPNWLFGPAWTTLYVLIAIAGWRIWRLEPFGGPMKVWWLQLSLNFLWSPVFFGLQNIALAFGIILALLVAILAFIGLTWGRDRTAALLFIPYLLWVAFASTLNGWIFLAN